MESMEYYSHAWYPNPSSLPLGSQPQTSVARASIGSLSGRPHQTSHTPLHTSPHFSPNLIKPPSYPGVFYFSVLYLTSSLPLVLLSLPPQPLYPTISDTIWRLTGMSCLCVLPYRWIKFFPRIWHRKPENLVPLYWRAQAVYIYMSCDGKPLFLRP